MERFEINKIGVGENLLYVLLWAAIFMVPALNASMTSQHQLYLYQIVEAWCKLLPYFCIFLINNSFFVPNHLLRKRYATYISLDILLVAMVFILVDYAQRNIIPILQNIFPALHDMAYSEKLIEGEVSFTDLNIYWNCTFALFMTAANAGIKLVYRSIQEEQKMSDLKRQNMQVEMDYLKYQINPHFFMNTLNNIHALIDIDGDSAKRTVIELSKMMRYVLYESGSESISLRKDLEFIRNYIELMRIRFDDEIVVRLRHSDDLPIESSIPPLLLIVFVENAFKHGVALDDGESYININLDYRETESKICCTIENSVPSEDEADYKKGIGLFNVRRRLDLLFGSRYSLVTEPRDGRYFVELIIPIKSYDDPNNSN